MSLRFPPEPVSAARLRVGHIGYLATVALDGPVAWWYLDEPTGTTGADHAGAHPLTYANVTLDQPGFLGGHPAADFNGTTSGASSTFNPTSGAITVETWFYCNGVGGTNTNPRLVCNDHTDNDGRGFELVINAISGSDGEPWFVVGNGANTTLGSGYNYAQGPAVPVVANGWHHLVGTYDGAHITVYLDAQVSASTAWAGGTVATGANTVAVGYGIYNTTDFYDGKQSMVAIYDTALRPERIQAHYAAGI